MSDLIDLNSPDVTKPLGTKLTSPLIPVPPSTNRNIINEFNEGNIFMREERESLGNNPFDMVLHKTIEYIQKEEDPFEIVLEKALKGDKTRETCTDVIVSTNATCASVSKTVEENKNEDEFSLQCDSEIQVDDAQSVNLSILNNSAMNDTLYETNSFSSLQKNPNESNDFLFIKTNLSPSCLRSYSESEIIQHDKQYSKNRSHSAIEMIKTEKTSRNCYIMSSTASTVFDDPFNEAFVQSKCSDNSVFSNPSSASSITRSNSTSLTYNFTPCHEIMNRAFLKTSNSSDVSTELNLSKRMDNIKKYTQSTSSEILVPNTPICIKESCDISNRLLENNVSASRTSQQSCTSSILDISSDSVFLENSKISKLILNEAKTLARTFEEFVQKSSESSTDELIINDPMWTSELLPAFDDELTDNPIELPSSQSNKEPDVSTLLLNLKKIVKPESNNEAYVLLENLEKALAVQPNDTKSLSAYLNNAKNSYGCDKACEVNLETIENVEKEKCIQVCTNNLDVKSIMKTEEICDNEINGHRNSDDICDEKQEELQILPLTKNMEEEINSTETQEQQTAVLTVNKSVGTNNDSPSENETNETVTVQLLIKLAKLLKESSTTNLLKNLGEVLNLAFNNDNEKNNAEKHTDIKKNFNNSNIKGDNGMQVPISSKSKVQQNAHLLSKVTSPNNKLLQRSASEVATSQCKRSSYMPQWKDKSKSDISEIKKRFSSEPTLINSDVKKKVVTANIKTKNESLKMKDTQQHVKTEIEQEDEKCNIKLAVKNKLKKKTESKVVNRKGPMRAVIPIGNMQKKNTAGVATSNKNTVPHVKIIISTPTSSHKDAVTRKSPRSKPVASSTPDLQKHNIDDLQPSLPRNSSCSISPLTTETGVTNNKVTTYVSPNKINKCSSPSRITPKRRQSESTIPKYFTSPRIQKKRSPHIYKSECLESPKIRSKKIDANGKTSPSVKKNTTENGKVLQESPLKDSNKITLKGKPLNLTSKLRRYGSGHVVNEKENNFT